MHLSQLEKVEGMDSRSLVVSRAHSAMFAGLMMSSVRRKESSDNYREAAVRRMSGRYWIAAAMQLSCTCSLVFMRGSGIEVVVGRALGVSQLEYVAIAVRYSRIARLQGCKA